jgi:3-dehydroquinate synthase
MEFSLTVSESKQSLLFSEVSAQHRLNELIRQALDENRKRFILVDVNTQRHCLPLLYELSGSLINAETLVIQPGERNKSIDNASFLWKELHRLHADRNSLFINLGGGVVSDLGGFVASAFMRGISFINIPTTLMAMADAAIGGKTAVNLGPVKNTIGTFYLPDAVFLFPGFLKTLDMLNLQSGLAEIYKIALVADQDFWKYLRSLPAGFMNYPLENPLWNELITRSAKLKYAIVEKDFKDKKERAILNFGHTIGHAIESYSLMKGFDAVTHGMAVSVGIVCESFLSTKYCGLPERDMREICDYVHSLFGHYSFTAADIPGIIQLMSADKKKINNSLRFTLLEQPGKAITGQVCEEAGIDEALAFYRQMDRD